MHQKSEKISSETGFYDANYQTLRPIFAGARKKYFWKSGHPDFFYHSEIMRWTSGCLERKMLQSEINESVHTEIIEQFYILRNETLECFYQH